MASSSKGRTTESSTESPANTFANDGSFMEMYKQKLKEMENTKNEEKEKTETEERKKTTNLLLQGKRKIPVRRKGGALNLDNKKKKITKEIGKKEENPDEKSAAWKAYMEEVQRYKEMSCTDDSEHTRPLVK